MEPWDAIVVGSGPNGLAAAIDLGRAGRRVLVLEAADEIGGGLRSDDPSPGLVRDHCAAVLPFAVGSPFFADVADDLEARGLRWRHPAICYTHPIGDGRAGAAWRDVAATADALGADADRYRRWVGPLARRWDDLATDVLSPVVGIPHHPLLLARFGIPGLASASLVASRFDTEEARGLLAGCAAHGVLPLERPLTAAFASLFLASAHAHGWPVVEGGSAKLAAAMAALVVDLGGEIRTGVHVRARRDLPPHRAIVLDTDPRQVVAITGDTLPSRYRRRLERFRFGPGVCKVDHVLDGPVPWSDPHSPAAGTVHVGGTFDEVARAEADVAAGRHAERPFVLVAQQDVADPTRRSGDRRMLWSYTHVPNGSDRDVSVAIEAQIERFAPGFRDRIVERHVTTATGFGRWNPNLVGGDITGGAMSGLQLVRRPRTIAPHATPDPTVFLCSASTPPGGGVHGMGGRHAAAAALAGVLR